MFNPPAVPPPPPPAGAPGRGGPPRYPAAKVDRALFDGDVVRVGPLSVTTYLIPGHSPSPVTFAYTVKDGGRQASITDEHDWFKMMGTCFEGAAAGGGKFNHRHSLRHLYLWTYLNCGTTQ